MSHSVQTSISQYLAELDPFDQLPSNTLEVLSNNITIKYLGRDEEIEFSSGCESRFLYIIRTGAIEQISASGELRARLGDDDQFGFTFLAPLEKAEDGYRAVALEDSLLYLIPHEKLKLICEQQPEFEDFFATKSKQRLKGALRSLKRPDEGELFFREVKDVASENIAMIDLDATVQQAAKEMASGKPSSCCVVMEGSKVVGVVTDRDMTTRVISKGMSLTTPISEVMTKNPIMIQQDDKVIDAVSIMLTNNVRCLPVMNGRKVVGLLTPIHLVHNHKTQSLFLLEKIRYASSVDSLCSLRTEKDAIFQALVESGANAETIGHVMSLIMDAFTKRLIELNQQLIGPAPCDFAWMVAGSHARKEVHVLSDQDSALVLDDNATESDRSYFQYLAMRVCNGLDACGYPLCEGKYMAASPQWCQPLSRWKQYYSKWVKQPEYNRLLSISVFLEVRCIFGNDRLVSQLQSHLHTQIAENINFLPTLVQDAVNTSPPLGIFNKLVVEKSGANSNTLNIKKYALNLIIDLARIYSLSSSGTATGTEDRFRFAAEQKALSSDGCENIIGAYNFISEVRFRHQLNAIKSGKKPDNHIAPQQFSSFERKHLKDAFKIISELQANAKIRFIGGA